MGMPYEYNTKKKLSKSDLDLSELRKKDSFGKKDL